MEELDFLNLKGKLTDRGPFGENEDKAIIFSVGNANEAHGYALPRDIDSRQAKWIAINASNKAGARYVGHIPYSTDRVGDIAINWSPNYIPLDKFFEKSIQFMKYHIDLLHDYGIAFEKIVICNFHGGNIFPRRTVREMKKELGYKVKAFGPFDLDLNSADQEKINYWLVKRGVKPGHADTTEHSIAAVLGLVDYQKLEIMNDLIQKDIKTAVRKWPAIGGLGGYLEFGGEEFDPLRDPKIGLTACYTKFKEDGKIIIYKELGQFIIDSIVNSIAKVC
jgi:creatinine amidohydrolase/Fe(II)-dependent formamide hydrolase-like protein